MMNIDEIFKDTKEHILEKGGHYLKLWIELAMEKEQVHNPFWCLVVEPLESRPVILWPPDFFRHYVLDITPDKDETEKRLAVKAKG